MKLFGFSSPSLYKFCPSKYNIMEGCNTLRIGTLWGFRKEENELLRDEGEGEFEFKVRFPKLTPVSQEWISEFEVGAEGSAHIEHMELKDSNISIKGVTLKGSSHNCWIFCVSMSGEAAGNISEAHESKWMIPAEKFQSFGNLLGQLLWNTISMDDLPENMVLKHTLQELQAGLALQVQMERVSYTDRVAEIKSELDLPVAEIRKLKDSIPFMKPKRFLKEQEFRFAFWVMFEGKKVSINDNPKILSLRSIDPLVSKA